MSRLWRVIGFAIKDQLGDLGAPTTFLWAGADWQLVRELGNLRSECALFVHYYSGPQTRPAGGAQPQSDSFPLARRDHWPRDQAPRVIFWGTLGPFRATAGENLVGGLRRTIIGAWQTFFGRADRSN
jgi:hypothetical protein